MPDLPRQAKTFIAAVVALDLVYLAVHGAFSQPWHDLRWMPFIVLMAMGAGGHTLRVAAHATQSISVAFIIQLASIPLLGVWGAVLVSTLAAAVQINGWSPVVRAFNAAQFGVGTLAAGAVYATTGGSFAVGELHGAEFIWGNIVPLILAAAVMCVMNAALVAGIVHFHKGVPAKLVFWGTVRPGAAPYVGYGMFGILLAVLWDGAGIGPLSAVLVLAPLYVARWAWAQYAEEHEAYERTVRALVGAVEAKDLYTRGHNERVSRASVMIAQQLGLGADRTEMLRFAGILHDVGKIGVPTRVLRKTGRLTEDEFAAIALHPVRGLDMVRGIEFLEEAYAGILHHHERLDGRGYPMGLAGTDIPEFARIIGVADAFDSMTSTRSYRQARPVADAVQELRRCSGTQFDPQFVAALIDALEDEPWEPAPAVDPEESALAAAGAETFDHDDPTAPPPPGPPPRIVAPPEGWSR